MQNETYIQHYSEKHFFLLFPKLHAKYAYAFQIKLKLLIRGSV